MTHRPNTFVLREGRLQPYQCQLWNKPLRRSRKPLPARLCEVKGCGAKHHAKGMCKRHYARWWYRE